ncbi:MAG: hypothetical protein ACOC41_07960 [Chitinivibrionales bacterium]
MYNSSIRHVLLFCLLIGGTMCVSAQNVSGVAHLVLNAPASQEHRQKIKSLALDSLKNSIMVWMKDIHYQLPDSTKGVEWHHFLSFVSECAKTAEKQSFVEAREWTLRLDLTAEKLKSLLDEHNAQVKPKALKYWDLAREGMKHGRAAVVFTSSVHTLYNAMGHLGEPLFLEKDGEPVDLKEESRKALQEALNRLKIQYSSFIIKGKSGNAPDEDITITATIDSAPLAGLPFTGFLPDGNNLFKIFTTTDGTAQFGEYTIPFVSYGTFLHVQPNLGAIVQPSYYFTFSDFGVMPGEGHNQTLMFNIVKQAYKLEYKVSSANQVKVSSDFSNGTLVRKFLEDSCNLITSSPTNPADLKISIQAQVSSYTHDSREETEIKAEALIKVKQLHSGGNELEESKMLNQKTFDSNHKIPTGLFFWETTQTMRNQLRDMLNSL